MSNHNVDARPNLSRHAASSCTIVRCYVGASIKYRYKHVQNRYINRAQVHIVSTIAMPIRSRRVMCVHSKCTRVPLREPSFPFIRSSMSGSAVRRDDPCCKRYCGVLQASRRIVCAEHPNHMTRVRNTH